MKFSLVLFLLAPVLAQGQNGIEIENPWSRTTPPGVKIAAGYLVVRNGSDKPDRLLGAASPLAAKVETHVTIREGEIVKMREVQGYDIPAKGSFELKPGGAHLMFVDIKRPFKEGEKIPATLRFARAGDVKLEFQVSGTAPDPHQHQHGAAGHGHGDEKDKPYGRAGNPKKAARTIDVEMSDKMRFAPAALAVKQGETVRFRVKNSGQVVHEMVLGTLQELKEHAELMKKHPGMDHHEPHMAHVAPGKTGTLVWQFTQAGEFYYGCMQPGHFEAGMVGKIVVK